MNFGQRERVERGLAVILTAASAIARWTQRSLIGLLLALGVTQAQAQSAAVPQPYTEVFYPAGRCASKPTSTGRQEMDRSLW